MNILQNSPKALAVTAFANENGMGQLESLKKVYNDELSKVIDAEVKPLDNKSIESNEPVAASTEAVPLNNGTENIFDTPSIDTTPTNADIIAAVQEPELVNEQERVESEPVVAAEPMPSTPEPDLLESVPGPELEPKVVENKAETSESLDSETITDDDNAKEVIQNDGADDILSSLLAKITSETTEIMLHCAQVDTLVEVLIQKYGLSREKMQNQTQQPSMVDEKKDAEVPNDNIFDTPSGGMHM